jgi:hypothetical protein
MGNIIMSSAAAANATAATANEGLKKRFQRLADAMTVPASSLGKAGSTASGPICK